MRQRWGRSYLHPVNANGRSQCVWDKGCGLGWGLLLLLHVHVRVALSRLPRRRDGISARSVHRAAVGVGGQRHDHEAGGRGRRRHPLLLLHLGLDEVDPGVDLLAQLTVDLLRRPLLLLALPLLLHCIVSVAPHGLHSIGNAERGELRVDLLGPAHRRLELLLSKAAHGAPRDALEADAAAIAAGGVGRRVRLGGGALVAALGRRQRGEPARLAARGPVARGAVLAQLARRAARLGVGADERADGGDREVVGWLGGTGFLVLDDYLQTEEQRGMGMGSNKKAKASGTNKE